MGLKHEGESNKVRVKSSQAQRCNSQDNAFYLPGTCCKIDYIKDANGLFEVGLWSQVWQLRFPPDHAHSLKPRQFVSPLHDCEARFYLRILKSTSSNLAAL